MNSANTILSSTSRVLTLVFTDLAGSLALKIQLGDAEGTARINEHFRLMRALLFECGGREVGFTGDGAFIIFETPTSAVEFALRLQEIHAQHQDLLPVRVGIHMGEVTVVSGDDASTPQVEGLAVDLASRLQFLALPGQVLMSYPVFDSARQRLSTNHLTRVVQWMAHGDYFFKGQETGNSVFEAGLTGLSPLTPPGTNEKAARSVAPDEESTLGWRPSVGSEVPARRHWIITEKLGEGGFGDVWLAEHEKTRERRVFKFCYDPERLRSLKREVTLFRVLKEHLGEREDMARVLDYRFDEPPFYLEMDYRGRGDLSDWAEAQGGLERVDMDHRLEIIARIADALQAAHSVGVLHKDLKPSNVLVIGDPGAWRVLLIDFGIGTLASKDVLANSNITMAGLTEVSASVDGPSVSGTRIYVAPEIMEGKPASVQSDIFSLGVLFYQMVAGDLRRVLASGWERHVSDPLLRDDIAACIDGNPAERLLSAGELAERLRNRPQRQAAVEERKLFAQWHEKKKRWKFYGLASALSLLAILIATGLFAYQQWEWRKHESFLRTHANEARKLAQVQTEVARQAQDRAETVQHYASISLAESARSAGNLQSIHNILFEDILPHRRGREWGWLLAQTDQSIFSVPRMNVFDMEPSPDSKVVAVAVRDLTTEGNGGIYLLDAVTGTLINHQMMHSRMVWDVRWSRDGRRLITSSTDQTAKILDAVSLETLVTLTGHGGIVRGGDFSPDGNRVVTIGRDESMKLWDSLQGELILDIPLPGQRPSAVVYHPSRPWVAVASVEGIVGVYDTSSGDLVTSIAGSSDLVSSLRFSADGKYLVAPSRDPMIRLYDTDTFITSITQPTREIPVNESWPVSAEMDTKNTFLVVGCDSGICYRQDLKTDEISHRTYAGEPLWKLEMAQDDRHVYATTRWQAGAFDLDLLDTMVPRQLVDAATLPPSDNTISVRVPGMVRSRDVSWNLDEAWETSGKVSLFEVAGRKVRIEPFTNVYSPDGSVRVVFDRETRRGRVEDVRSGTLLVDLGENVCDAAFSDDGVWLAVQTSLVETRRFKTSNWQQLSDLVTSGTYGCKVIFEPGSHRVVTGNNEGFFTIWDIESGEKVFESPRLFAGILAMQYSPDKAYLGVGYDSNLARVFATTTYDQVSTMTGHSRYIHSVGFTRDSSQLITAARDGSARLWDVKSGKYLVTLYQTADILQVLTAFFTPDDSKVVVLLSNGTVAVEQVYPWIPGSYPVQETGSLGKAIELWKRRTFSGQTVDPDKIVGRF